jgi:DivIVA domain-containing protein
MNENEPQGSPKEDQAQSVTARQGPVPAEIRNVSFPVSVRGYDRRAVDVYVQRVNRVIAELEVTRSPQAAVRHAVDRVSEQTKGILQQARESAEQITAAAREEAEQIIATAKAEAAELVVNASTDADRAKAEGEQVLADARSSAAEIVARSEADAAERLRRSEEEVAALQEEAEARIRELQADTEAVWTQRRELLGEIDGMATRLREAAAAAAARFTPEETGQPPETATDELQPEPEGAPTLVVAPDKPEEQDSRKPAGQGRRARSSRPRNG